MRPIDADKFDRMAKEQHEMWVGMMETDEKYKLIDAGFMLAADVMKGMPTVKAAEIARALLPEAPGVERGEIVHVYENSRLSSAHFSAEAVTAAYVEGLAALHEVDALRAERDAWRARCEAAEADLNLLAANIGDAVLPCMICQYEKEAMISAVCGKCFSDDLKFIWRGPETAGGDQSAPGDAPVNDVCPRS